MDLSCITVDPAVHWATPCIRDTEITVGMVVGMVLAGASTGDVMAAFAELIPDDVDAAMEWYAEFGPAGLAPHPPDPGDRHPHVAVNPSIQSGYPTMRGTRIPVDAIVGLWERGYSVDEITGEYPRLTSAAIEDAIDYAVEAW